MARTRQFKAHVYAAIALMVSITLSSPASAQLEDDAAYTDQIYLRNGDRITGNMKELSHGKLRVKTRTMDTIMINWVDIDHIESDKWVRVERTDGSFNYGPIEATDARDKMAIGEGEATVEVPMLSVATIQPIRADEPFWKRLEGDASIGIDYTKASDILNLNLASNLRFREEKYEIGLDATWNETARTETQNSSRMDISTSYTRFRENRWFWKATAGLDRNQELGIDIRGLLGGTVGRFLLESPTTQLELSAGLALNHENRTDATTVSSSEGLIRSSLYIFKHTLPITRLTANLNIFPGISESGRLRANASIGLRNEIFRSVFWDLSIYGTYDNRPPEGAAEEDYGIITSLGASF